jgi:hypothetical protein
MAKAAKADAPVELADVFKELKDTAFIGIGCQRVFDKEGNTTGYRILTMQIQDGVVIKLDPKGLANDWRQAFLLAVDQMGKNL